MDQINDMFHVFVQVFWTFEVWICWNVLNEMGGSANRFELLSSSFESLMIEKMKFKLLLKSFKSEY